MAKYAIGDIVTKSNGRSGVVRAIFKTMAGELCYAVEHEGALDFVDEAKLSPSTTTDLAACVTRRSVPPFLSVTSLFLRPN